MWCSLRKRGARLELPHLKFALVVHYLTKHTWLKMQNKTSTKTQSHQNLVAMALDNLGPTKRGAAAPPAPSSEKTAKRTIAASQPPRFKSKRGQIKVNIFKELLKLMGWK